MTQKSDGIFSGLAHFVKGGIFFWYGLLTLGRVMGSFADIGWSWNIKPPTSVVGARKAAAPTAEFMESFLIFLYGATNVWLEHLGEMGKGWSAGDLEHVSISIMFFGGGLVSMSFPHVNHKTRMLTIPPVRHAHRVPGNQRPPQFHAPLPLITHLLSRPVGTAPYLRLLY